MKRFRVAMIIAASLCALAAYTVPIGVAEGAGLQVSSAQRALLGYDEPLCQSRTSLCADPYDNPPGEYVGHDEPSVLFKSHVPGSGNDITYTMTLPRDTFLSSKASAARRPSTAPR